MKLFKILSMKDNMAYVRTYVLTYVRTYMRTYVHTYVRTYVRTYVHICVPIICKGILVFAQAEDHFGSVSWDGASYPTIGEYEDVKYGVLTSQRTLF